MATKYTLGGGRRELLLGIPTKSRGILEAAARVHAVRERAKRIKKRLKDREDVAVLVLVAALERSGQEACKVGPYLIMAESKTKIRIQKKLERKTDGKR